MSYQPDWLRQIKVTRSLESGRQSTKTLFRNPEEAEERPGPRVRTRVSSPDQHVDFEVSLEDPRHIIRRVTVETVVPGSKDPHETIVFSIDAD